MCKWDLYSICSCVLVYKENLGFCKGYVQFVFQHVLVPRCISFIRNPTRNIPKYMIVLWIASPGIGKSGIYVGEIRNT